jgi:hypothetical protein
MPKFAAVIALCENESMNMSKPKAKPARKSARAVDAGGLNSAPSKTANPYAMSAQEAAAAVRRAGIVTPGGKLTRIYK